MPYFVARSRVCGRSGGIEPGRQWRTATRAAMVRTGKPAPLEKLDQIWKVKAQDPRRATSMMRELFLEVPAP